VLSIFHNYRVKIDERDVYVHQHFHHELEERLGGKRMNLPQVFINGQHIGNKQEVDELNEIGEIKKLLENIPRIDIQKNCTECGGFGLVPCTKCNGSKNSVANSFTSEFRALKCTACNENGLQPCQKCN
jgi:glutaredoxin domain-containing cysteine-rich protein 1